MQPPQGDSIWGELAKIDYFLEHLARAADQGKIDPWAYESISKPYWARRADIVAVLERPRQQTAPAQAPASPPAGVSQSPATFASSHDAAVPAPPIEVNWTGLLLGVGSLLVIVAAAVFAIATWDTFSVTFRIGFLGLLTAGFYIAGALVRTKLDLETGGAALLAVASAMLLFDGWIVIDGYGLDQTWWLLWLAACSGVYWVTEVKVSGRFFGVIGAAAQVAWVWLAADGFEWPYDVRFAVLALVALAWAVSGKLAQDRQHIPSLASILRYAAPVAVTVAVGGVGLAVTDGPIAYRVIASAAVVALCATATFDLAGLPRGIAAVAQLPLLAAIARMASESPRDEWIMIALLVAVALLSTAYELFRAGWGHGVAAFAAEMLAVLLLADVIGAGPELTVAMVAALAALWIGASRVCDTVTELPWAPGLKSLSPEALLSGYGLLGVATVAVPVVSEFPLGPEVVSTSAVLLTVLVTALWFAAGLVRPERIGGVVGLALTPYTVFVVISRFAPDANVGFYAAGVIVVIAGILVGRRQWERIFLLPGGTTVIAARVAAAGVVFLATAYALSLGDIWDLGMVFAFAASAGYWAADAATTDDERVGFAFVAPSLVFAVGIAAAVFDGEPQSGIDAFSVVSAGTAFVLALAAAVLRRFDGFSQAWSLGAGAATLVACGTAVGEPGILAVCLVFAALAWGIAAYCVLPELLGFSVFLVLLALFSAMAHFDAMGWITVAAVLAATAVAVAPVALLRGGIWPHGSRAIIASVVASITGPVGLLVLGVISAAGLAPAGWTDIGEQGLVLALIALAAYGFGAGALLSVPVATWVGGAALLLAGLVEMGALDVSGIEPRTTAVAVYVAWLGSRIARSSGPAFARMPFDIIATLIALVPPTMASLFAGSGPGWWEHLAWALGLSIAAIALGVTFRVRAYLFGGAAAILVVAVGRSWLYVVTFWWIPLGIIGIGIIVVALTAMRQRALFAETSERVTQRFEGWR